MRLLASFVVTVAAAFAAAVFIIQGVQAQDALQPPNPGTGVDFAPELLQILDYAGSLLAVALSALVAFLIRFVLGRIGLDNSQLEHNLATRADEILHLAIQNGIMWMKVQVADPNSPVRNVELNNMLLEYIVSQAKRSMPDIIKRFKWTDAMVRQVVMSRLDRYFQTPDPDTGSPVAVGEARKTAKVNPSVAVDDVLAPVTPGR